MISKKNLIMVIIIILAAIACLTTYMLVNSQAEGYGTLKLSDTCSLSVPLVENSVENLNNGISNYSFNKSDLNILYQKSKNNTAIKSINIEHVENSKIAEDNIYYDEDTGVYSVFIENNNTSESLLITCHDLDLLKNIRDSVKFSKHVNNPVKHNVTTNISEEIIDEIITGEELNDTQITYDTYYEDSNYNPAPASEDKTPQSQNTPQPEEEKKEAPKGYNDVISL